MTIWGVAPGAQGSDPTAGLRLELVAVELVHLWDTKTALGQGVHQLLMCKIKIILQLDSYVIYVIYICVCVISIYKYHMVQYPVIRQDPEVCPDSQRASGQAKMTMMMTMMMITIIIFIIILISS